MTTSAIHSAATDHVELMTVAGPRLSLLTAGDDDEVFMTRSLNVTPKTREEQLIVGQNAVINLNSESSNNKRPRSLLKLTSL